MKYRFGMPWYGWLVLFILLIFFPEIKKRIVPTPEPKKDIVERKE
jgi:hypothetical protein